MLLPLVDAQVTWIAMDASFFAIKQLASHDRITDIGWGGGHSVDQTIFVIEADVQSSCRSTIGCPFWSGAPPGSRLPVLFLVDEGRRWWWHQRCCPPGASGPGPADDRHSLLEIYSQSHGTPRGGGSGEARQSGAKASIS